MEILNINPDNGTHGDIQKSPSVNSEYDILPLNKINNNGGNHTMLKAFILSVTKGIRGNKFNTDYPIQKEISNLEDLQQAALFDHAGGIFKNNHRSNSTFISTDVIFMDCDNDDDNPDLWATPEKVAKVLKDVAFYAIYSKSHNKNKLNEDGTIKAGPRPRFHCYFPLSNLITNADKVRELKEKILTVCPFFDKGAKDAARFFAGVDVPVGETYQGSICIDEFMPVIIADTTTKEAKSLKKIKKANSGNVGNFAGRNDFLHKTAFRALMNYDYDMAVQVFNEAKSACEPPLPEKECQTIWNSALKAVAQKKEEEAQKWKYLSLANLDKELTEIGISLRYNVITGLYEIAGIPKDSPYLPEKYRDLTDAQIKEAQEKILPLFLTCYLKDKKYKFSKDFLIESLGALALTYQFNPVEKMLKSEKHDGINRIDELCNILGFGGDSEEEHKKQRIIIKWLAQAVSMALNDDGSVNNDFMLILCGPQGTGKSETFRILAYKPEWFKGNSVVDMSNKDTKISATNAWITEFGEINSITRKEQADFKGWVTDYYDKYRKPYDRNETIKLRRTCFAGTVNNSDYLTDETGNRRYATINVDYINIDRLHEIEKNEPEWIKQLWIQVYEQIYLQFGKQAFRLTHEDLDYIESVNADAMVKAEGEITLYDKFDFNIPVEYWKEYSVSKVMELLKLTNIKDKTFGRTLSKVAKYDKRVKKIKHNKYVAYLLPPFEGTIY